ncbi:aldehyde dehydrogenase family protein [Novosphingobium pentaromativorans]|uniref:Putative aldehyde dehydrogenase n=1 Tax=Novosphingobium pentaromativorans US6-1 TaxID=1088721 RepID=G6EFM7_9SPHN|nr:aldehyde dehydrogenase family protein [Novosphingobium pentaromativorans]EHJ59898.1 putative aldehyde dehydrogenase [Novosphingobium pentaromativorans US6-1]
MIGGRWVAGTSAANINPSDTNDVIGDYAQADEDQARLAIEAARDAFPGWSRTSPQQRADLLDQVGSEILLRRDELTNLLAREEGKTRAEATGEVTRAGQIFKFFAGEAMRIAGDSMGSVRPGIEVQVTREPVGVVSLITPWNFPIAIPAWKIAPALAFGNCVIFKPADLVPGCAWALAEMLDRAGCPAGVFNLVMGRGRVLGDVLVGPGVDAVSFTGSTGVGASIHARAAQHNIRVQLEMGGKNPLVILNDADLDLAARIACEGAFGATGQRCTASSRLIVEAGVHDAFVARMSEEMGHIVVGDARAADTTMGPVVDGRQLEQDLEFVHHAQVEGARLVCGGTSPTRESPGYYLAPTLFSETTHDMRINREEVFGPVASILRVEDYDEALAMANDTPFGLCAGICTTSLGRAMDFRRNAQVGMVMVNVPTAGVDYHVPFGGRKASSHGPREQGRAAVDFYTNMKTSYFGC